MKRQVQLFRSFSVEVVRLRTKYIHHDEKLGGTIFEIRSLLSPKWGWPHLFVVRASLAETL